MSAYAKRAKRATRRARRRIARWIAPELEAELRAARRKLKKARADTAYDLPEELEATIARAREEHLTYLKPDNLRELAARVLDVEKQGIAGLVIEAGTARGGSAIVMAAAKAPERPMKVYDVFGMIPPPTDQDGEDVHERYAKITAGDARGPGGEQYYGYRDDLYTRGRAVVRPARRRRPASATSTSSRGCSRTPSTSTSRWRSPTWTATGTSRR